MSRPNKLMGLFERYIYNNECLLDAKALRVIAKSLLAYVRAISPFCCRLGRAIEIVFDFVVVRLSRIAYDQSHTVREQYFQI